MNISTQDIIAHLEALEEKNRALKAKLAQIEAILSGGAAAPAPGPAPELEPEPGPAPAPKAKAKAPPKPEPVTTHPDPGEGTVTSRVIATMVKLGGQARGKDISEAMSDVSMTAKYAGDVLRIAAKRHPSLVEKVSRGLYGATEKARRRYAPEPAPVQTLPDRGLRNVRPTWFVLRKNNAGDPIRIDLGHKGQLPDGHTAFAIGTRKNGQPGYALELDGTMVYDWWVSPDATYRAALRLLGKGAA